jgi:hypothetical protein
MQAKSGKKIETVKPAKPEQAFDADEAAPGNVAKVKAKAKQIDSKKGKYDQSKTLHFKPKETDTASSSKEKEKERERNSNKPHWHQTN